MKKTSTSGRALSRSGAAPLPGRAVRGSSSGRPIMALLDLLGRRWTLRLLWELREGQAESFRSLQSRTDDVSPSILNARLKELREAGLVTLEPAGYVLTDTGAALLAMLEPLDRWAKGWARALARPDD
jgi:DNA-binding HxlR family transcriptional regulator